MFARTRRCYIVLDVSECIGASVDCADVRGQRTCPYDLNEA